MSVDALIVYYGIFPKKYRCHTEQQPVQKIYTFSATLRKVRTSKIKNIHKSF